MRDFLDSLLLCNKEEQIFFITNFYHENLVNQENVFVKKQNLEKQWNLPVYFLNLYNLNNEAVKDFLKTFYQDDKNKKRSGILMHYCVKIFENSVYNPQNYCEEKIKNIYINLYALVDIFSTSLILEEDKKLRFIDICIFTLELLLCVNIKKKKDKSFFTCSNVMDTPPKDNLVKIILKINTLLKVKINAIPKEHSFIVVSMEKSIYFFIILINVIQNGILRTLKIEKSTQKKPYFFNKICNPNICKSNTIFKHNEETIFFALQQYITSKKIEFKDIKDNFSKNITFEDDNHAKFNNNIYSKKLKVFYSSTITDFIIFFRQNFSQSVFFNIYMFEMNKLFLVFELFFIHHDLFIILFPNQKEDYKNKTIMALYNKILVKIFLNDQNLVEKLLNILAIQ